MASFTVTIPNTVAPRVLAAVSGRSGQPYDPQGSVQPADYIKSYVVEHLMSITRNYEADMNAETAKRTAAAKATTEIVLT